MSELWRHSPDVQLTDASDAPFPYFGGKRRAAPAVWQALGDPTHYVEPFAGSAAVMLARPAFDGMRTETLNDADGWLVNMWRSIQLKPAEVAKYCDGPVAEIDINARKAWLQERRGEDLVAWLEGDPEHCDPKAAGWWLTATAGSIGVPLSPGPWHTRDGYLRKGESGCGIRRVLPHLGPPRGIYRVQEPLRGHFERLARRLSRARITCGSWDRVVTHAAIQLGSAGYGDRSRGVFLDPPYATSGDIYVESSGDISAQVRQFCLDATDHILTAGGAKVPLRIVLAGYDDEHDELLGHGWWVTEGKSGRGNGMSKNRENGRRERLWMSPACHRLAQDALDFGSEDA